MPKAVEVFTPNTVPTYTYVERQGEPIERHLANALQVTNTLISLAGPSKSGKTVLLKKLINPDDLIYVTGSSIVAPGDLWKIVLAWVGGPVAVETTKEIGVSGSVLAKGETQGSIIVAKATVGGEIGASGSYGSATAKAIAQDGLIAVAREIANSSFVIFIDDFHYIDAAIQQAVAREIKSGIESGIRICVASVPHRADDVVRSNNELRGRVFTVDTKYWNIDELAMIAEKGFAALNVDISPAIVRRVASEAFGSPQLMQLMCLNICFRIGIFDTQADLHRHEVSDTDIREALELTAAGANFQSLLESLHSGPRQRGMERNDYDLIDGSKGDVYRAILLAIKSDPGQLSFNYEEMQRRVKAVCVTESPVGGSMIRSLEKMDNIAAAFPPKAIEWLEDVLDIVDPYFLFYLRASLKLDRLGGL